MVVWSRSAQWCLERMGLTPSRIAPVARLNLEASLFQHVPQSLKTALSDMSRPGLPEDGLLRAEGHPEAPDRGRTYGWPSEGADWLGQP